MMPSKEYRILLDGKIVDQVYTKNSFESMLNIYKNHFGNRVSFEIINL